MYGIISHGKMVWIYMLRLVSTYLFSLLWTCEVTIVLHYIIHSISSCWNLASGWSTVACSSIRVTRGAVFISNIKEMALHGAFFFYWFMLSYPVSKNIVCCCNNCKWEVLITLNNLNCDSLVRFFLQRVPSFCPVKILQPLKYLPKQWRQVWNCMYEFFCVHLASVQSYNTTV